MKECQCFADCDRKIRIYCNGCGVPFQYKLITKDLLDDENKRNVVFREEQECMEIDENDYNVLLRKVKIDYVLSLK